MFAKTASEGASEFSLAVLGGLKRVGRRIFRNKVFLGLFDDRTIVLSLYRDRYFFLLDAEHRAVCDTIPVQFENPVVLPVVSELLPDDLGRFLSQELGVGTATFIAYDYRGQRPGRGLDAFPWQDRFSLILRELGGSVPKIADQPAFFDSLQVYWKLVLFGFLCRTGHTRLIIAGFAREPNGPAPYGEEKINTDVVRCINRCLPFVPFKIECLAYAAALGSVLRARGGDACLVIGVRSIPFEAHAWIEVEGRIVGERDGLRHDLNVIFESRWLVAGGPDNSG